MKRIHLISLLLIISSQFLFAQGKIIQSKEEVKKEKSNANSTHIETSTEPQSTYSNRREEKKTRKKLYVG